jgi:hypothetical protein
VQSVLLTPKLVSLLSQSKPQTESNNKSISTGTGYGKTMHDKIELILLDQKCVSTSKRTQ